MVSGRSHGGGAGLRVDSFLRQAGGGMAFGGYGPMGGGGCDLRFQPYGMTMGCGGMPCMGMGCMGGNGMAQGRTGGGITLGADRRATSWLGAGLGRGNVRVTFTRSLIPTPAALTTATAVQARLAGHPRKQLLACQRAGSRPQTPPVARPITSIGVAGRPVGHPRRDSPQYSLWVNRKL